MGVYEVGDKVVYAPHGAGVVVATTHRDDAFGEYLQIRISQNNMTLMVPAALAAERGVRPVEDAELLGQLLQSLNEDGDALPTSPQQRSRDGQDRIRSGDADILAGVLRDYGHLERSGKKLSATELRTLLGAKQLFASELALVNDIPLEDAVAKVEQALDPSPSSS